MVEKLTENKQINPFTGFIKSCDFAADVLAKIEDVWRRVGQYFNVIVGTIAAAYTLSLAVCAGTAKTTISVWLFPLHCIVAPIVIISAIIYLVHEANSKLTTLEALNQSQVAFTNANNHHKTQIQKLNDEHRRERAATQKEMSDVLGKFTEHA